MRIVENLLAEFGPGNLVILAFSDADMATLRLKAMRGANGDIGRFIRQRIAKGGAR